MVGGVGQPAGNARDALWRLLLLLCCVCRGILLVCLFRGNFVRDLKLEVVHTRNSGPFLTGIFRRTRLESGLAVSLLSPPFYRVLTATLACTPSLTVVQD